MAISTQQTLYGFMVKTNPPKGGFVNLIGNTGCFSSPFVFRSIRATLLLFLQRGDATLTDDLRKALNDIDRYSLKDAVSPLDQLSKKLQEIKSPLEKAMPTFKNPLDGIDMNLLRQVRMPSVNDFRMPELPPMKSIWQIQAELFMEGLQDQVQELESGLKSNEELLMTCWHGHEKLQVLSISMPSQNVVALRCVDADGNQVQFTGHMNSVTFSFMVRTTQPPARRNKIGFSMPGSESENDSE